MTYQPWGNRFKMDMELSAPARKVVTTLAALGVTPMIVGGSVRDQFLGMDSKDIDIEVFGAESYDQLARALSKLGVPTLAGAHFGVLTINVDGEDFDVSLPRREKKSGKGHRAFDVVPDPTMTPAEASLRRDFTINSLMWNPTTCEVEDYNGGVDDISRGRITAVSEAFAEDPLRPLRGAQFAARFGFTMDERTIAMAKGLLSEASVLPVERIRGEMTKLIGKGLKPSLGLENLRATGWADVLGDFGKLDLDDLGVALDKVADNRTASVSYRATLARAVIAYKLIRTLPDADPMKTMRMFTESDRQANAAIATATMRNTLGGSDEQLRWDAFDTKSTFRERMDLADAIGEGTGNRARAEALGIIDGPEADAFDSRRVIEAARNGRRDGVWIRDAVGGARAAQYARSTVAV